MSEQPPIHPVPREQTDLNQAFLELLARLRPQMPQAGAVLGLRGTLVDRLVLLTLGQRKEIACCPFPLYSLRLHDLDFWTAPAVADREIPSDGRVAQMPEALTGSVCAFTQSALLYAWHVCRISPQRARIAYGLPPACARHVAQLPITLLQQRALQSPELLRAALADNPRFWPDLLDCVALDSPRQLRAARLLGLQLLATRGNRRPQ